jgi:NADH-quinone oxidoreductase subunit A
MQYAVLPIFLFLVCAIALAVGLLIVAGLFNPGRPGRVKRMPYESGMDPIHDTRRRFDVRFHLLAIAFLVFDVELLFLFPWAVAMKKVDSGQWTVSRAEGGNEKYGVRSTEYGEEKAEGGESSTHHLSFVIHHSDSPVPRPSSLAPLLGIDAAVSNGLVESRDLVFVGAMIFLALLTLGFVYDWRMGVFRWR